MSEDITLTCCPGCDRESALKAEIAILTVRAERLRLELEKIGWMDEFLDADGAKAMMNIAREAVNADEGPQNDSRI